MTGSGPTFDLDPHGRLVPQGDEVRRALGDRAGRFVLLPAAFDLLLARRQPPAGGLPQGSRCVLCGDLSAFPIADFLGFLHTARLSGGLTVASGGVERTVVFKQGEVRGAQSEAPGERIGEVALRMGFLRPDQLEKAAAEAAGGGKLFGKVLVERGLLQPAELWKCLHEQVTGVFHAILLAREGVFSLLGMAEPELPGIPLSVNTQQLLMDGIRRIDELELFRSRIPGPGAFLRRREPRRQVALKPLEAQLLALVDGRRTVADVARAAHLSDFDATKVLYHLAEAGYLEAVDAAAGTPAVSPEARQVAICEKMSALCRDVAAQIVPGRGAEPLLPALRGFLADTESRFAPLWVGLQPAADGTLDPAGLLGNLAAVPPAALVRLEPSGDPSRYLHDGLRELLFFLLFQAGERLPREADERLSTEVKRRLDALGSLR
ncbi:MAG: DUF4388 domain-containing protein [Deltaproteobacteria bacterium]|nr:DUF4388 domain-containing protein [Deltaproteobacteria bacterium]